MKKRILIIGGTGVFGKRLAHHLCRTQGIELFVSSRSSAKAENLANRLAALSQGTAVRGVALDTGAGFARRLAEIHPFVVVDCSGPFQGAGYDTAKAAIEAGAHYVDLADARSYLADFPSQLNAVARKQNVVALTGASSTPALSSCAVAHMIHDWQRTDVIDIAITPGGRSEVGRSVIEAILSYAGKDVPIWEYGRLCKTCGWTGARTIDVPNIGRRRVAFVDTIDAEHLGKRHNVRSRVSFSAGLESWVEQFAIETLARMRRGGLLINAARLAPFLIAARRLTRLPTSDTGGMVILVKGLDANGQPTRAIWSLLAKDDHGPFVPVMPAAAVVTKLLMDVIPAGAAMADHHLCLKDITDQMAPYNIVASIQITQPKEGLGAVSGYNGAFHDASTADFTLQ